MVNLTDYYTQDMKILGEPSKHKVSKSTMFLGIFIYLFVLTVKK